MASRCPSLPLTEECMCATPLCECPFLGKKHENLSYYKIFGATTVCGVRASSFVFSQKKALQRHGALYNSPAHT